jgi:hypothetical protein
MKHSTVLPVAGQIVLVYDVATFMADKENQDAVSQGMRQRDEYIQQGLIPFR